MYEQIKEQLTVCIIFQLTICIENSFEGTSYIFHHAIYRQLVKSFFFWFRSNSRYLWNFGESNK